MAGVQKEEVQWAGLVVRCWTSCSPLCVSLLFMVNHNVCYYYYYYCYYYCYYY